MRPTKTRGWFTRLTQGTARATGRPATFSIAVAVVVVWAVTGPLFWYVTLRNLGAFDDPETEEPGLLTDTSIARYHWVVPAIWYIAVTALVVNTFYM